MIKDLKQAAEDFLKSKEIHDYSFMETGVRDLILELIIEFHQNRSLDPHLRLIPPPPRPPRERIIREDGKNLTPPKEKIKVK